MKLITIPPETTLWTSDMGEYKFHYPSDRECQLINLPEEAEVLNWIGDATRTALYFRRYKKVLWINKETLRCISQTNSSKLTHHTPDLASYLKPAVNK